jgi:endo-1,4-beta-xylanase
MTRSRAPLAAATGAVVAAAAVLFGAGTSAAAVGCAATYTVANQWADGFTGGVRLTNVGDPWAQWTVTWSFGAGQRVTNGWGAVYSQNGAQVSATNLDWNRAVATGGSLELGFNGSWNGASNPAPATFTVNGQVCTGTPGATTTTPPPTTTPAPPTTSPPTTTAPPPAGSLPSSFRWQSSNVLIGPRSDASHNQLSIKDPSVVNANGRWHVFASTTNSAGNYSLVYLNFTDWAQAAAAPQAYLSANPNIGTGYRAAPQVFFFAPQNRWYLVYQTGPPSFSTNTDISQPNGWTAPRNFYASTPPIVTQNQGSGTWIDFWTICDTGFCYLFFSDDNGHLYRARTTVANFPNGFGDPVIVLTDSRFALFEASNVYKLQGQNKYLLLVEAIGSDGKRYFRSWTTTALDGSWTPLANTEANPFSRASNVTFDGTPWTRDISHGEMIRAGNDQTLTINPCHLQYLYQGVDPNSTVAYNFLPWRLGLLTQTNSTC